MRASAASAYTNARREKAALFQVVQHHLLTFEQQWADEAESRILLSFSLRFPLAFDGKLLSQVVRIFIDTVATNYRKRLAKQGIPGGKHGAVAVIQRANSDLRCNSHVHPIVLDRLYAPNRDVHGFMFHPAPTPISKTPSSSPFGTWAYTPCPHLHASSPRPSHASKRILRFLQRRGEISLVTASGDEEVTVVTDESMGGAGNRKRQV